MTKEYIGLDTYLYTYTLEEKEYFLSHMEMRALRGTVTEVFINNGYAFEYKPFKQI